MTIKQQGGVFGRNPTFNDVTVDRALTVGGPSRLSLEDAATNTTSFPLVLTHTTTGSAVAGFGTGINFLLENTVYSTLPQMATIEAVERSPAEISADLVFKTKWQNTLAVRGSFRGRASPAGVVDFNINAGNVVVASGYGIDFSATSGTGTSELFNDYEEGTWTPTFSAEFTTAPTVTSAQYTKIGRQVTVTMLAVGGVVTAGGGIGGLPFASNSTQGSGAYGGSTDTTLSLQGTVGQSALSITNIPARVLTGSTWQITATYFTT
jgi:hypothetical protein